MSKKHFEDLAEMVRGMRRDQVVDELSLRVVAIRLADVCQQHNPAFNRGRFLSACGVEA